METRPGGRGRVGRLGGFALALVVLIALSTPFALAAPPSTSTGGSGGHLPHFNLLAKRVAIAKLPFELRFSLRMRFPHARSAVRFGEARLPDTTITAAGNRRNICVFERPKGNHGGSGTCGDLAQALETGITTVSSCSEGGPLEFRIAGIVPNGIESLGIERREDGKIEDAIPVVDNAFFVSLRPVGVVLHGIGDSAAEHFELKYPLAGFARLARRDRGGGCSSFTFAEAKA
jgi:hypothetical protein